MGWASGGDEAKPTLRAILTLRPCQGAFATAPERTVAIGIATALAISDDASHRVSEYPHVGIVLVRTAAH